MSSSEYHAVEIDRLRVGAELEFPIYEGSDVLLLAPGHTITDRFLERLRTRGIDEVRVHQDALAVVLAGKPRGTAVDVPDDRVVSGPVDATNDGTRTLDEAGEDPEALVAEYDDDLAWHDFEDWGDAGYDDDVWEQSVEHREAVVADVADVFEELDAGGDFDTDRLDDGVKSMCEDLRRDRDLFAVLGINPASEDYPARHGVQASMVAVALGTTLGLSQSSLRDLGLGCLVHDAGMLRVGREAFELPRPLTDVEYLAVMRHPVNVFDMLAEVRDFPRDAAFVAYQMHERLDGSGYPRGTSGTRIHELAKIAAVADAYVALVSPRPHRPAQIPHHAIRRLLFGVKQGRFDSTVVRGLLRTISLFPLGSRVRLSDGRVGNTVRANGEAYDRPTVEVGPSSARETINLSTEPSLEVTEVLPPAA